MERRANGSHQGGRWGWWVGLAVLATTMVGLGCGVGEFVDQGIEGDSAVDQCTLGATRCQSDVVMACKTHPGGTQWTQETTCALGLQMCKTEGGIAHCVTLPSCTDKKKNRDETDVDCGGSTCGPCEVGKVCKVDHDCKTQACEGGTCRLCRGATYGCLGNFLRQCKADHSGWTTMATCNPAQYMACDASKKACEKLTVLGSPTPTGTYYLFGFFETGSSAFKGGYDVDGYLLYVNNRGHLDVYRVTLADTDGDGKLEPNQHPDNKDKKGPIEKRTLTFVKTYTNVTLGGGGAAELYATKDAVFFLKNAGSGTNLYKFVLATGQTSLVLTTSMRMSSLGFDDQARQWFFAYNSPRRVVFAYWPKGGGLAAEFWYPNLAGSHLDGMEVVTDPKKKRSYVYVSDMTSDFLGQYYFDRAKNQWIQENIFQYKETHNQVVEGMGFGAFQHFWATSGRALYEVGGGDLQKYVGIK